MFWNEVALPLWLCRSIFSMRIAILSIVDLNKFWEDATSHRTKRMNPFSVKRGLKPWLALDPGQHYTGMSPHFLIDPQIIS